MDVDAIDKGVEVGWIVEGIGFGLDAALVGGVLVVVDGVAHHPEVAAEFAFLFALDLEAGDGDGCRGENADDGDGDDELDEGDAGVGAELRGG